MKRYQLDTYNAACTVRLSTLRCGWAMLARGNADDPDLLADVAVLRVGQCISVGGGAAPVTRISRIN